MEVPRHREIVCVLSGGSRHPCEDRMKAERSREGKVSQRRQEQKVQSSLGQEEAGRGVQEEVQGAWLRRDWLGNEKEDDEGEKVVEGGNEEEQEQRRKQEEHKEVEEQEDRAGGDLHP